MTGRRIGAAVGLGGVALLLAFVLPPFLLKLAILLAAGAFVGLVLLPRILGPERARTALALFSLAVASMAVALVAGEFVVRLVFADVTTTNDNTSFFARRWRSGLSSNSLGFREREIDPEPAEGVYRIAVIGDSFTWGQGIDRSDRMTERLQALLDHTSGRFEVLNFGLPGRETVDHLRTLRDVVLPLHPDFVLLQWFINDVEGDDKSGRPIPARLVPSDAATAWLSRHSALYHLLNREWQEVQVHLGLVDGYLDYMNRRFADPSSPDARAAEAELKEFVTTARDAGVDVGIVAFPNIEFVASPDEFSFGYLIDRVVDLCREEAVECLDLREAFAGASRAEPWWASKLDSHPGPRANEVAAREVAARFSDRWLAAARTP